VFNSVGREGLCGFHGPDIKIGPTKFRCLGNCCVHKTFFLAPWGRSFSLLSLKPTAAGGVRQLRHGQLSHENVL